MPGSGTSDAQVGHAYSQATLRPSKPLRLVGRCCTSPGRSEYDAKNGEDNPTCPTHFSHLSRQENSDAQIALKAVVARADLTKKECYSEASYACSFSIEVFFRLVG